MKDQIYFAAKRFIDIVASIILMILFLPIWILIPILIKLESNGPIFYTPERVGRLGKTFKMFKFRSMKMFEIGGKPVHAVEFWKYNQELFEKYKKAGWKLTLEEDPRVTRLGKILRQTSIDEFPQLLNILMGDMSLVGPRTIVKPEIDDAIKQYGQEIKPFIDQSLTVKPGLTGPWQVSGRNLVPWNERVKMGAEYAKRKNLLDDIAIIFKTPFAMISKW